jgi:hypothetical protein
MVSATILRPQAIEAACGHTGGLRRRTRLFGVAVAMAGALGLASCAVFEPPVAELPQPAPVVEPPPLQAPAAPPVAVPRPPRPKPAPVAAVPQTPVGSEPAAELPAPELPASEQPASEQKDSPAQDVAAAAPEPAPAAPARALPVPPPAQDAANERLLGLDAAAMRRALGEPQSQLDVPPARVWRYTAAECWLDIYFYMDVQSREFRVLHYEAIPHDGSERQKDRCVQRIFAEQNGASSHPGLVEAPRRAD